MENYNPLFIITLILAIASTSTLLYIYIRSVAQRDKMLEPSAEPNEEERIAKMTHVDYTTHDEAFLNEATQIVMDNLGNHKFECAEFQQATHTSKSTLYRRIKRATNLSPNEFIRHVRLVSARDLIVEKQGRINISELAIITGFNTPRYFTLCFKKEFGMSPSQFIKQGLTEVKH